MRIFKIKKEVHNCISKVKLKETTPKKHKFKDKGTNTTEDAMRIEKRCQEQKRYVSDHVL
jgi:hypothetical protein